MFPCCFTICISVNYSVRENTDKLNSFYIAIEEETSEDAVLPVKHQFPSDEGIAATTKIARAVINLHKFPDTHERFIGLLIYYQRKRK